MNNKLLSGSFHFGENQKTAIGRKEEPADCCYLGTCANDCEVKCPDIISFLHSNKKNHLW